MIHCSREFVLGLGANGVIETGHEASSTVLNAAKAMDRAHEADRRERRELRQSRRGRMSGFQRENRQPMGHSRLRP